ncbi:heterogeneous nuclear ribonucleoprotein K-like isoform X2 [Paramacrobiotus metropolitanus]|uniref:heterogeneous nuclear ribonucleoprotein K-like isoform X2 n=1 Tax=Paramacrobiotus metropolitanus TaxID=2943436 RepID=UPI002445DC73|nr:heterogeneous nuclear ribonucleoprotein K-like isoform X2 [Paramacrobiotus metropolitanus]
MHTQRFLFCYRIKIFVYPNVSRNNMNGDVRPLNGVRTRCNIASDRTEFPSRKKETTEQRVVRERQDGLQAKKASEVEYDVELRFLLHSKSLDAVRHALKSGNSGVLSVRSHKIQYTVIDDESQNSPEGILALKGHFNSCLCVLETWNARYFTLDHFKHEYYGGVHSRCIRTRHLVHDSVVGMLIGVRGIQVDSLSYRHDCNIQIPGTALPKSTERVVSISGRIPDTVKVVRDIFLVIASRPHRLVRNVTNYHPSNYDYEVAKRAGGIYDHHAPSAARESNLRHSARRRRSNKSA